MYDDAKYPELAKDRWFKATRISLLICGGIMFILLAFSFSGNQQIGDFASFIIMPVFLMLLGLLMGMRHGFEIHQRKVNSPTNQS